MTKPEEVKKLYGAMFEGADYRGVTEILINRTSGWAEASKALKNVIEAAIAAGVKYIEADISSLEFDDQGSCIGVRSASGNTLSATHIILATGAGTAKLIAKSAPDREDGRSDYLSSHLHWHGKARSRGT
jgi:sarcosine oxidase/L-pipecolate oxidase